MRTLLRILIWALATALVLGSAGLISLYFAVRASLPQLDGRVAAAAVVAPVSIERDALGTATVRADNRNDALFALGFVHAQERYFEMDLARRQAAGELAALLGPRLTDADRRMRGHRLRARAQVAAAALPADQSAALDAYVGGVNAGLDALGARPFAYLALRQRPQPWAAADSMLVVYSMFTLLTGPDNRRELDFDQIARHAPPGLAALFDPGLGDRRELHAGSEWDAPLDGAALPPTPLPGAAEVDLRDLDPALFGGEHAIGGDLVAGSNAFAVAGALSRSGHAVLQNDMHLGLGVPNIWFRTQLDFADPEAPDGKVRVTGVSLPGVPGVIAGSNGHIAWGFTNSYLDANDWVIVRYADADQARYCTATSELVTDAGTQRHCTASAPIAAYDEVIEIAGADSVALTVRETRWGPILAKNEAGEELAASWIAHRPGAIDLSLLLIDRVEGVAQALALGQRAGMPPQNLVVADRAGSIGWTVAGRIPRRQGFFARLPADWSANPGRGWFGWLEPEQHPKRLDPASGALWTANQRLVGGAELALLGDGGYALGARGAQIRDTLLAGRAPGQMTLPLTRRFDARSLLDIALDDRALFLERWHRLLSDLHARHPQHAALTKAAAALQNWGGRASRDSVGYRIVRGFRIEVSERVVDGLTAPIRAAQPEFKTPRLEQIEGVVWRLLEVQPAHLLPPAYADWDALLLAAADAVLAQLESQPGGLDTRTWGERNSARIGHPLARALPALGPWLDMPAQALDGDSFMPRVQGPAFGASQRMAVMPGYENESWFHMPGGQSGHPLSPFYGAGHQDWVHGRASAFLPGSAAHALHLEPAAQ